MKLPSFIDRFLKKAFVDKLDEVPFIIFISFLVTFIVSRSYVYMVQKDILVGPLFVEAIIIRGIHVHHLNFGIVILAICGFTALYDLRPRIHRITAIFYGIGLALTFDEFALWLLLEDNYYARVTYDAIIIITLIFLNIIYFPSFWRKRGRAVKKLLSHIISLAKKTN
jgi:hypothetical protein